MKLKKRLVLSTTQIIMLSFLLVILCGSLLLWLPISAANGVSVSYADALFTATTATCVTGLVTLPTVSTWSLFGQLVILLLIQIGGLGVVTVMSGVMIALHRRMGLRDRILLQDAFNLNSLEGLLEFVRRVLWGTLIVEGIGALLYMTVFVPELGVRGIWVSVFNSVSAFCNAGIDVLSHNSLCDYATHPVINVVTSVLIILGGLGYVVWWDLLRVLKKRRRQGFKCLRSLTLHSKMALSMTAALLLFGTLMFLWLEAENPLTMQGRPLGERLTLSFFQSVTTRTAGFATLPQEHLTNGSVTVSLILMLIGGSPVGTAGGMKTVTLLVLIAAAASAVRNRETISVFHRTVSPSAVRKAIAVACMLLLTVTVSTVLLSVVSDAALSELLYETVSATATVGLTRNLTPSLNLWGKLIITATMYLGRVGPISLAVAFGTKKENQNLIEDPTEEINVG